MGDRLMCHNERLLFRV